MYEIMIWMLFPISFLMKIILLLLIFLFFTETLVQIFQGLIRTGASLLAQRVKNLPAMRDLGSIPGFRRSLAEGKGYPLQCSDLVNSMEREAWQAIVHWVAKSWTQLSMSHMSMSEQVPTLLSRLHYPIRLTLSERPIIPF